MLQILPRRDAVLLASDLDDCVKLCCAAYCVHRSFLDTSMGLFRRKLFVGSMMVEFEAQSEKLRDIKPLTSEPIKPKSCPHFGIRRLLIGHWDFPRKHLAAPLAKIFAYAWLSGTCFQLLTVPSLCKVTTTYNCQRPFVPEGNVARILVRSIIASDPIWHEEASILVSPLTVLTVPPPSNDEGRVLRLRVNGKAKHRFPGFGRPRAP